MSVLGTVVVVAIIVVFIVATKNDDKATPAASTRTSPSSSAAPSTTPRSSSADASGPGRSSSAPSSRAASTRSSSAPPSRSRTATAPANDATNAARTAQCSYTRSGTATRSVNLPATNALASGTVMVDVRTSQGPLTFALDRRSAPCAAASFVSLARQGYYTRTPCHRLVTKRIYVAQCGDPTGTGRGGPGYTYADELSGKEVYRRGVLAMANAGVDRNGSQFFIVYRRSDLGPQYTIFGRVTSGLATVDKVAAAGTDDGSTDGKPKLALTIRSATVR